MLRALIPLIDRKTDRDFLTKSQKRMEAWNQLMEERYGTTDRNAHEAAVVTWHLNKLLDGNAIVSSDSGTIATWTARYIEMRDEMKFSLSGLLATMANGCHYSISGQRWLIRMRQVVCVVGDGGRSYDAHGRGRHAG